MKPSSGIVIMAILAVAVFVAGCATHTSTPAPTTPLPTAAAPARGTPSITIVSPQNDATLPLGDVPVAVLVGNLTVVDKQGMASIAGEGHIHFFIDVNPVPAESGKPAIPANANSVWAHVVGTKYTFSNVGPGVHTIAVELVNNDHTPLQPPVIRSIMITATNVSGTPGPAIATTAVPPTVAPAETQGSRPTVTLSLVAKNIAFETNTLTVPAGAHVIMTFDNQDAGITHNFALYSDYSAGTKYFAGDTIKGPKTTTYEFDAPSIPGDYYFRCDPHPEIMHGTFIVT